ncbi:MAG: thioredoxin family protein [Candidatus Eisenbacteria bacterium]|uniref:Thioredoxin family protein n=1 Tax=Eiseniibacteriota bacterium TaxID=2212470 RepID=A0A538U6Z8_UNCEI|nr:MAG: thioredoxin family protein [Candidatus Eisenbacteria bacterium]
MKHPILVVCTVLACASIGAARARSEDTTALAIGDAAPLATVKMKNIDGRELSIADVRGAKGTLVVFSCNACPWARAWETRIVALGNAALRRDVGVIVINSNDPSMNAQDGFDVMKERARERKMRYPYVVDGTSDVARAFGATHTPEAFLFDARGRLVYHGTVDDNAHEPDKVEKRYLRDAVDAVVAGKPVEVQETKSLGCSIKFRPRD